MTTVGIDVNWIIQGFIYVLVVITGFLSVYHLKSISSSMNELKENDKDLNKTLETTLIKIAEQAQRMNNFQAHIEYVRDLSEKSDQLLNQTISRLEKDVENIQNTFEKFRSSIAVSKIKL